MRIDDLKNRLKKERLRQFHIPYRLNWGSAYLDCAQQKVVTSVIDRYMSFYYTKEPVNVVIVESKERNEVYKTTLGQINKRKRDWSDYIDGCIMILEQAGFALTDGAHIIVENDLPSGIGLASSACFIIGILKCLFEVNNLAYDKSLLVALGYHVEHDFLKIPCGLMDFKAILHDYGVWYIDTESPKLERDELLYDKALDIALVEDTKQHHEHLYNEKFKEIAEDLAFVGRHPLEVSNNEPFLYAFQYFNCQRYKVLQIAEAFKKGNLNALDYKHCQQLLHDSNIQLNYLLGTIRFYHNREIQMLGSGLRGYGFALLDPHSPSDLKEYEVQYCHTLAEPK